MPRRARIVAAGFPMHAILRGIDRAAIFFADEDYDCFKIKLSELATAEISRSPRLRADDQPRVM